jgi:Family of unknown function (DUF6299)
MRARRACSLATVIATVTLGVGALGVAPASAAVPSNDTIATATEITSIPFTDTVDTTDATTDSVETSLNAGCGAPVVEHGVWYHATIAQDGNYVADVTQSNYSAGIMVVAGPISAPTLLACGPGSVSGPLTAGQDIFLLVFGDGGTTATSGTMVLNVDFAPPPPTVNLTVDSRGSVAKDGSVALSGTISCTGAGDSADIFGSVEQSVGRFQISGFFDTTSSVQCDGTATAWQGFTVGQSGRFSGGKASVDVLAQVCSGLNNCGFAEVTATVQLSGGHNH